MSEGQADRTYSQSAAHALIKRVINARREQEGFLKPVTVQQWSEESVAKSVSAAGVYLAENCCGAERDDLAQNLYPDDAVFELALQAICYALNGLMAFPDNPLPRNSFSPALQAESEVSPPEGGLVSGMSGQEVQYAAASEYVHWLLEADEWVQEYRARLPRALTEQEMVDFLYSPLSQVFSFSDFQQLNLCPFTTPGQVTVISQREIPRMSVTKAQREVARRRNEPLTILVSELLVEVQKPDGTTLRRTVERRGRLETMGYRSWAMEAGPDALAGAGGFRDRDFYCFHKGSLGDRECYPAFPAFSFTGYPGSICAETFGLMTNLLENDFYSDQSAALRFLLMGVLSSLFEMTGEKEDSIFLPAWGGTMSTKSVLHIPNWILPEELADFWRQVRPPGARERRLPSASSLDLFRYVTKNTPPGTEPQWSFLARGWAKENRETLTRDKLYKAYYSVLNALFPCHPSKQHIKGMRQNVREGQQEARRFKGAAGAAPPAE